MNSYIPHDSNTRNKAELIQLRIKHGAAGYGVYWMILERLREDEHYMSITDYNSIAFDLHADASLIKSVVEQFGLFSFTENGECFYSELLNDRMALMDSKTKKRAEAGKKGAAKRWGNKSIAKPSENNSNAIAKPSEIDSNKIKQNKTKLNKTNTNNARVSTPAPPPDSKFRENFTHKIWPLFGKKTKFEPAYQAYYEDLLEGATDDQIIAALKNLTEYYRINGTQQRYMVNPQTYFEERRYTDSLDLTPPAPKMANGRPVVKESLPTWAEDGYQPPKREVTAEQRAAVQERLAKLTKEEG